MKGKQLMLIGAVAAVVLALGAAIAWAAAGSSGNSPALVQTRASGGMDDVDMDTVHRALAAGDPEAMARACEKAMKDGRMPANAGADHMRDDGHMGDTGGDMDMDMDTDEMDDMMGGGGMMGGGMH